MIAMQQAFRNIFYIKRGEHMRLLVAFGLESTSRQFYSDDIDIFSEIVDERPSCRLLLSCDAKGASWVPKNRSDLA